MVPVPIYAFAPFEGGLMAGGSAVGHGQRRVLLRLRGVSSGDGGDRCVADGGGHLALGYPGGLQDGCGGV